MFKLVSTWCDLCWPKLLPPYALASIRNDFFRHCQLGRSEISDFNAPGVEISAFNAFNASATTKK